MESKLLKIAIKFNVEIDLKVSKEALTLVISNKDEVNAFKGEDVVNLLEKAQRTASEMSIRFYKNHKDLLKDLFKRAKDKEIFPDDLFKDKESI